MRRSYLLASALALVPFVSTSADDRPFLQRIAERAPLPHHPVEHTMARAGFPQDVKPHAVPSLTRFYLPGYIGGGTPAPMAFRASGPATAVGHVHDGTFGSDFAGFGLRGGRVFLAPVADPQRGNVFSRGYSPEGPRLTDIGTLRPYRKAILELRAAKEHGEGHGGEGGHGGGGEAKGGGH
jgi:hypothetical protein